MALIDLPGKERRSHLSRRYVLLGLQFGGDWVTVLAQIQGWNGKSSFRRVKTVEHEIVQFLALGFVNSKEFLMKLNRLPSPVLHRSQ
jgi:hypothetical protein